ncbi:MAG: glucose-6-phosphate isomerase [Coriobacteriales bacterium]|nr:glucose-6-phosphate isomerase [Coriobacteriales bacterium]
MAISLNLSNAGLREHELEQTKFLVDAAYANLMGKQGAGKDFLGWLDLDETFEQYCPGEFERLQAAAKKIQGQSEVLIAIGIGGSYLGARAGLEFVFGPFYNQMPERRGGVEVYFAGNNISSAYVNNLFQIIGERDFSVNVISKSGTTTEPAVAFRIFKEKLEERYGKEGAKERIYATTDAKKGALRGLAEAEGYQTFVVPDPTGGRFSGLTAVGLLPMAAGGVDIAAVMDGYRAAKERYDNPDLFTNDAMKYAAARFILMLKGKSVEVLANYEPALTQFGEWYKQLMAESEGKDNKGLFPVTANFSTDLHSIGQFIQDGSRTLFETVLWVRKSAHDIEVPHDPQNVDGLNFAAGKTMQYMNEKAMNGTLLAHVDGGVPNVIIELDELSDYGFGELVFFFWKSLAISGYLLGINPFNQPGVEDYKKNMFALLGKPGYEDMKAELEERLAAVL